MYGAALYVGLGYEPYDGKSDWSVESILGYPQTVGFMARLEACLHRFTPSLFHSFEQVSVNNVFPDNIYFVAVQGLTTGGCAFSISTKSSTVPPPSPPSKLSVLPVVASSRCGEYTWFYLPITQNANGSTSLFLNEAPGCDGSDDVFLLLSSGSFPTLGQYAVSVELHRSHSWITAQLPYIPEASFLGVAVHGGARFYINATAVAL
jgi:hypothetical protein